MGSATSEATDISTRVDNLSTQARSYVDARPILPASESSLWSRAARDADSLAARIDKLLKEQSVRGWVRKSQPGEYPYVVAADLWQPIDDIGIAGVQDRSHLSISITVEPYLQNPLIHKVEVTHYGRSYTGSHWYVSDSEISELVSFLVAGGRKPKFFKTRIPIGLQFLHAFLPFISLKEYENRLTEDAKPTFVATRVVGFIAAAIMILSAITSFLAWRDDDPSYGFLITLSSACVLGVCIWRGSKRPVYHAVAKQPLRTPRRESLVDSWQISVPEAGVSFESFKSRLLGALQSIKSDLEFSQEEYQSRTPRGFETRERFVITKGQGNVHVHIQPFGRDTFVSWESYLNWARWGETEPVSIVIREGKRFEYRSVTSTQHIPSSFDLMELSALAETVHRNLVREVKGFLKEREIEADLDFRIIRGDRNRALSEDKNGNSGSSKGSGRLALG